MSPARIRRVRRAGAATGRALVLLALVACPTSGVLADTPPEARDALAASGELLAAPGWEPPAPDSAAYPARFVEVTGEVAMEPAVPGGEVAPEANSPLPQDDLVVTGPGGAATLELPAGWAVRVGENSRVRRWEEDGAQVIGLEAGSLVACGARDSSAAYVVSSHGSTWLAPGTTCRAEVTVKGTELDVRGGRIEVTTEGGRRVVEAGRGVIAWADSARRPRVRYLRNGWDSLDASADAACARLGRSAGLGDLRLVGAGDLADHGSWVAVAGESFWCPRVASDWSPFSDGCFRHDPRWGWGFIPRQPWGFVTHHHGYWVKLPDCGWAWAPGDRWHPHLVSFWTVGQDVYWCPRPPPPSCPVPPPPDDGRAGNRPEGRPWREHATGVASLDRFRHRIVRATPVAADGDGAVLRPPADPTDIVRRGPGAGRPGAPGAPGRLRPADPAPSPAWPAPINEAEPPRGLGNDLQPPPRDVRVHGRTFVRPALPEPARPVHPEAGVEVPRDPLPTPERPIQLTVPTGVRVLRPPSQPSERVLARPAVTPGRPAARLGTGEVAPVPLPRQPPGRILPGGTGTPVPPQPAPPSPPPAPVVQPPPPPPPAPPVVPPPAPQRNGFESRRKDR